MIKTLHKTLRKALEMKQQQQQSNKRSWTNEELVEKKRGKYKKWLYPIWDNKK